MARPPEITRDQVAHRFEQYCPNEKGRSTVVAFLMDIYEQFKREGLADPAFDSQLVGTNDDQFQQRLSELFLAHWLWEDGFTLSSSEEGPDFKATKGDQLVWIELVTPLPTSDAHRDYARPLQRGEVDVRSVPTNDIKLRWLSVLADKKKQMDKHIAKGIIRPNDPYVVAVNKRRLDRFNWDVNGISQHPLPVEIGFGLGPRVIQIDRTTAKPLNSGYQYVSAVTKPTNGSTVEADLFSLPEYRRISAIFGIGLHDRRTTGEPFPTAIAYNPFATVPLPQHLIGAQQHWTGALVNDVWNLTRLPDVGVNVEQ